MKKTKQEYEKTNIYISAVKMFVYIICIVYIYYVYINTHT